MGENKKTRGGGDDGKILTSSEGYIYQIGFDRAAKYNGFSPLMLQQLAEAYTEFEQNDQYRVAVIYGLGDNFCAGLDLSKTKLDTGVFPANCVDPFNLRPPYRSKPLVVAVQGICYTLGVELALAADIVVAAENTRFSQLEVKRGVIAFGGATIQMVQRAGWGNAMRYLLTGDEWDVETAVRFGFVQEVVKEGQQLEKAMELAETISRQAPLAVKAMIESARIAQLEGQSQAVMAFQSQMNILKSSDDYREGIQSFLERRDGEFTGK